MTSTYGPPADVMERYRSLMDRADTVSQTPYQAYTGPRVAGFSGDQTSAFQGVRDSAGLAQPYVQEAAGLARTGASPVTAGAIQGYMNPYTQAVVDATTADFNAQNARQQSQVAGQAAMSGAYGDSAAVAKALAAEAQQRTQAPILAGLRSQGYSQALQAAQGDASRALQGAGTMGGLGQLAQGQALQGQAALLQTGGLQQALAQRGLDVPYQTFLEERAYPFQTAQWLAGIDSAIAPGMGGTQTTTSPGPNSMSPWLGAGMSALGLAGQFFLANGGRVGYADGGAVSPMPYSGPAMPYPLAPSMVPVAELRPQQFRRPEHIQPPAADAGMDSLIQGLGAATRGMRDMIGRGGGGQSDDAGSGGWETTVTPEGYADGGEVDGGALFKPFYQPLVTTPLGDVLAPPTGLSVPVDKSQGRVQPTPPQYVPPRPMGPPAPAGLAPPPQMPQPQPAAQPAPPPSDQPPPSGAGGGGPDKSSFATSPWGALTTAGLRMMASRAPTLGQAVGEGGLAGMQHLQQLETQKLQSRRVDLEAQRLADAAKRAQEHLAIEQRRLDLAGRDRYQAMNGPDGQAIAFNRHTGEFTPADGVKLGPRGGREPAAVTTAQMLMKENPGLTFSQALALAQRAPDDSSRERLAQSAAAKEIGALTAAGKTVDVDGVVKRWRKYYQLPDTPTSPVTSSPPSPSPPAATVPAVPSTQPPSTPSGKPPVPPNLLPFAQAGKLDYDAASGKYRHRDTKEIYDASGKRIDQ